MSGNHRPSSHPSNRRSLQTRRRYLWISLGILLLLTIASGIFVYLVSPLRDPSFQPNSANGGTLVPWQQSVRERDWIRGATGLAALLAINLALLLWQSHQFSRTVPDTVSGTLRHPQGTRAVRAFQAVLYWVVGLVLFAGLWLLFMSYLLAQWLVD